MTQNMKTSEIITDLKTKLQPIGDHSSESGYEMQLSTSEKEFLSKQQAPSLFKADVSDSMIKRIYEIKHRQNKPDFSATRSIDKDIKDFIPIWEERISSASSQDIAVAIETIASTLSCDIPTDLGLQQYFIILGGYPKAILDECVTNFIKTAKYRKLPLPSEFIAYIEPKATSHKRWLDNLKTIYNQLERKTNV